MKKNLSFLGLVVLAAFFAGGCASLNGDVPFRYQPSLTASPKKIDKVVGLTMLVDSRPDIDKAYTKSIADVSEKVTSKLLEDINSSKIFKEIHYPPQPGDDIVITGTIDNFIWKFYATPIYYIPILNLVCYFGVPYAEAYGQAAITLDIKDNKTGASLGKLQESSKFSSSYTFYNFKAGEAGSELADGFREVSKKLKEGLVTKVNF